MLQLTPGLPFLHVPGPSPPGVGDWFVVVYAAPLTAQAGRTPLSAMANRIAVASSGKSTSARMRGSPVLIISLCPFSSGRDRRIRPSKLPRRGNRRETFV
jgi:hypothetical protein